MNSINRQHGAALFTGLMMLLVLTLIGISAMRGTTLQEKMAGNLRESAIAFQRAENVVKQIEQAVQVRAELGLSGGITIETWADEGFEIFDCAGKKILDHPVDVNSGNWLDAPDGVTEGVYRVFEMSSVGGRSVACRPLEEEGAQGVGNASSYYLIYGYAEGPAERGDALVVSSYYYPGNE